MNYLKTIGFAVLFAISFGISSTAAEKSIRIAFMGAQTDEDMHGSLVNITTVLSEDFAPRPTPFPVSNSH